MSTSVSDEHDELRTLLYGVVVCVGALLRVIHPHPAPSQCGFFKRAPKDQYDAAYQKAEIHVQPSDKEKLTTEA